MKYYNLLFATCSVLALTGSGYAVASPLDTSHIHTQHTLGLKPISSLVNSYQTAATVFLPDFENGLNMSGHNSAKDLNYKNQIDDCYNFPLSACPVNAECSKCSTGNKYKLSGCNNGYKISGGACITQTCAEINVSYKDSVPTNQICTITGNCYSSCRTIDFSGYPLDSCPAGAVCTTHPDCGTTTTTKGNCSPLKQKVTGCTSSAQKVNSAATACIDKDDTCPATYFKSCETGTTGSPKYTEKGSACYQCKPNILPQPTELPVLYNDKTTVKEILLGKTPIGIVIDEARRLAVALECQPKKLSEDFKQSIPGLTDKSSDEAFADFDGKSNTQKIINACQANNKSCPAAEYTYTYSTPGTNAGDWHFHSFGELNTIYIQKDKINKILSALSKDNLKTIYHWSSSSYGNSYAWRLYLDDGYFTSHSPIHTEYIVCPVIYY